jgi:hypothetical protein
MPWKRMHVRKQNVKNVPALDTLAFGNLGFNPFAQTRCVYHGPVIPAKNVRPFFFWADDAELE